MKDVLQMASGAVCPLLGYAYGGHVWMIVGSLVAGVVIWGRFLVGSWLCDERVRELGYDPSILDDLDNGDD